MPDTEHAAPQAAQPTAEGHAPAKLDTPVSGATLTAILVALGDGAGLPTNVTIDWSQPNPIFVVS